MKLYIGCALNTSTAELAQLVASLKEHLGQEHDILEFKGLDNGSPEEIVTHDLSQVRNADCMIAICDIASTGLGIEIGTCNALGTPIALCAQTESISSMVRGNHVENPRSQFITYDSVDDLIEKIDNFIQSLS